MVSMARLAGVLSTDCGGGGKLLFKVTANLLLYGKLRGGYPLDTQRVKSRQIRIC